MIPMSLGDFMRDGATPVPPCGRPIDPVGQVALAALIAPDLEAARDDDDLQRRLARYGYAMQRTGMGRRLVTVPHGVEVMALPALTGSAPPLRRA